VAGVVASRPYTAECLLQSIWLACNNPIRSLAESPRAWMFERGRCAE
jgi:hypothetical protein